jgi:polyribonucleotide nucleotidyltransferase
VNLLPGTDGLLHISQISNQRIANVADVLSEGQKVMVQVVDVDQRGRIKLTMKDIQQG